MRYLTHILGGLMEIPASKAVLNPKWFEEHVPEHSLEVPCPPSSPSHPRLAAARLITDTSFLSASPPTASARMPDPPSRNVVKEAGWPKRENKRRPGEAHAVLLALVSVRVSLFGARVRHKRPLWRSTRLGRASPVLGRDSSSPFGAQFRV